MVSVDPTHPRTTSDLRRKQPLRMPSDPPADSAKPRMERTEMARDAPPQSDTAKFGSLRTDSLEVLGFAPPESETAAIDWLQLIRSPRIGPTTFLKLMRTHKTARAALNALPNSAAVAGLKDYRCAERRLVETEYVAGKKLGARLVALGSAHYSKLLMQIDDPPPLLWCLGDISLMTKSCVAIAGARNASSLGMRLTRALSKGLGDEGAVVVSGMARGIDKSAHEAALATGTIGVLAGGVDVLYPRENNEVYARIRKDGLIVSEQPIGLQPQGRHFPRRNRIISGLSLGLVVPEAATKSGSLITARDAAAQGREVMAVPGHPFDARAAGCNQLLRDGATLVRNAKDVIDALQPIEAGYKQSEPKKVCKASAPVKADASPNPPEAHMDQVRARILAHLGAAPLPEDQLIRDLGLSASVATSALVELEMVGRVIRQPGGTLQLGG